MQQAPFEYPIASKMDNYLAAFNAKRNVIPRTVKCLTMQYPDPEVYATGRFLSKTNTRRRASTLSAWEQRSYG